ncbi:SDR family NAD(P)-dependent oxidoreductase [Streptomyces parvulus]|uniref:SDR family NAD(P)-dependent oxidoreductase n=1 Tax=Streptomyces parvulus TaxID=146923 RepID=UPI0033DD5A62
MTTTPKIALITGGSRGIGLGTARALAAADTDVILTYRSGHDEAADAVNELRVAGRRAHALALDVEQTADLPEFAAAVGRVLKQEWDRERLDFLVNNAGSVRMAPFADLSEDDFDFMMNVHLKGPFFLTQALLALITDGGRIINISTNLTRFTQPGMAAYATAKGALETLTMYLAKELGPRGITVNSVAPGATATDFGGGFARSSEAAQLFAGMTALGRVGQPADIGRVVAALLGPAGNWVTAQRIEASGGMMF